MKQDLLEEYFFDERNFCRICGRDLTEEEINAFGNICFDCWEDEENLENGNNPTSLILK